MNETEFIRRQLAAERAHLREILEAVRRGTVPGDPRPVTRYIDWAGRRLVQQLAAQQAALEGSAGDRAPGAPDQVRAALAQTAAALAAAERGAAPRDAALLAALDAWTEPLDGLAGRQLRIDHWRQAAPLSADSILEERRLYAAARAALGPP